MAVSKKIINAKEMEKNIAAFACPICTSRMALEDYSRLVCTANHSFDLSRQGYVNLAPQAHTTKYDKVLFEARKKIIASGFFNPLLHYITEVTAAQLVSGQAPLILDAGCGEGSHLTAILSKLPTAATGVGIDLAREGVLSAAKEYPGHIWSVADLANCPFQDHCFDVIFNILSPANYKEFKRLLKPGGLFIKVVPESGYLKELREVFYESAKTEQEVNPVERVETVFQEVKTKRLTYQFSLNRELLQSLIEMTPLTWGASEEKVNEVLQMNLPAVTIDFNVIIGINEISA